MTRTFKALSALLKSLTPGKIELRYSRDGREHAAEADLAPR